MKSTTEKRGESMTNYDMDELRRQGKIPEELKEGEYRKHQEKFDKKSEEQKRIYQDYMKLRADKKNDRFDLEEAIQSIWQTEDDLDTVLYAIMDAHTDEPPSNDEIVNMILGIKELHGARMQRLWDIFEDFVHGQHDTMWKDIKDHQSSDYADRYEEKYDYPSDAVSPEPLQQQQQDEETRRKNIEIHKAMIAKKRQEEIKAEDEKREIKTVSMKEFMEALGQMDNGGDDNGEEYDATKFDNADQHLD